MLWSMCTLSCGRMCSHTSARLPLPDTSPIANFSARSSPMSAPGWLLAASPKLSARLRRSSSYPHVVHMTNY